MIGSYVYGSLPSSSWEQQVNATVDYRVREGFLKNFWLRVRYATNESNVRSSINDFRVIVNYGVSF